MHDAGPVRSRQPGRHLTNQRQHVCRGEPPFTAELLCQCLAVQQLHRQQHDVLSRVVRPCWSGSVSEDVVDATDVRMGNLPGEVHLTLEQRDRTLVGGDMRQDGLEGNPFAQFEIFRLVQLAHAALGQVPHDAEARGDDVT